MGKRTKSTEREEGLMGNRVTLLSDVEPYSTSWR
jgi:hypothetical protein